MSVQGTNFKSNYKLKANGKTLSLSRPVVMGILNLTPDSFFDGAKNNSPNAIIEKVEKHILEGASIIDIGAVSTKPGATNVSEEEELRRLIPALKLVRNSFVDIFISVDTFRSAVATEAAELGADIINDISAGTLDEKMFESVAKTKLPYIMMHMQGTPQTMQVDPHYKDVVKEVFSFLKVRAAEAIKAGIKQLVLDPGFGFGKTVEHNFKLLADLNKFENAGYPMLAGISRKSMVNKVIHTKPENALNGTTVLNTLAILNGANILRVHDVKEAMQTIKLVAAYRGGKID